MVTKGMTKINAKKRFRNKFILKWQQLTDMHRVYQREEKKLTLRWLNEVDQVKRLQQSTIWNENLDVKKRSKYFPVSPEKNVFFLSSRKHVMTPRHTLVHFQVMNRKNRSGHIQCFAV